MLEWKKLIGAKIVLAKRGAKPSAADVNNRILAVQTQVNNFAVLDMDWQGAHKL